MLFERFIFKFEQIKKCHKFVYFLPFLSNSLMLNFKNNAEEYIKIKK